MRPLKTCASTCKTDWSRASGSPAARFSFYGAPASLILAEQMAFGIIHILNRADAKAAHEVIPVAVVAHPGLFDGAFAEAVDVVLLCHSRITEAFSPLRFHSCTKR